jgi:hypothetical protein
MFICGTDWQCFGFRYLFCIFEGNGLVLTCAIRFILLIWKGKGTEMTTVEWVNWKRQGILWPRVTFASSHFQNSIVISFAKHIQSGHQSGPNWQIFGPRYSLFLYSKWVSTHMWKNVSFILSMGMSPEVKKGE